MIRRHLIKVKKINFYLLNNEIIIKFKSNMVPHSVCARYLRCLRQHKVQAYNEERNQHWNRRMLSENDRTTVEETKRKIQL